MNNATAGRMSHAAAERTTNAADGRMSDATVVCTSDAAAGRTSHDPAACKHAALSIGRPCTPHSHHPDCGKSSPVGSLTWTLGSLAGFHSLILSSSFEASWTPHGTLHAPSFGMKKHAHVAH
eukprot:359589-Chlamydomonas_euryale.AAC.5